jgi:predicted transcriptional regulator
VREHHEAIRTGEQTPAERAEFSHLPMRRAEDGTPVFDVAKMRVDQRDDLTDFYARKQPSKHGTCYQAVREYVEAFGQRGLRLNDIAEELRRDRKDVRNALRKLETQGILDIREEPNPRGNGASNRKRYFLRGAATWAKSNLVFQTTEGWVEKIRHQDITEHPLSMVADTEGDWDIHRQYHGSSAVSAACECARCRRAYQSWWEDAAISGERRQGGTGLRALNETRWYGPLLDVPKITFFIPIKQGGQL